MVLKNQTPKKIKKIYKNYTLKHMKKRIETLDQFINETVLGDKIFKQSKNDDYWKEAKKKFLRYNFVDHQDHVDAVEFILKAMKKEYSDIEWIAIESEIRNKIKDKLAK